MSEKKAVPKSKELVVEEEDNFEWDEDGLYEVPNDYNNENPNEQMTELDDKLLEYLQKMDTDLEKNISNITNEVDNLSKTINGQKFD